MRHIIPVISGKGGVGKSTVAVNVAIALAKEGRKVALIDADFYGPSVPTLMGGGGIDVDSEERLIPPVKFGVKYISLGFFLRNPDDAVIWRGPMFNKGLTQMFQDVAWGDVDYCVVDMPPGTGDAQISLAQNAKLTGALIVTTPQEVALADVRKAINMLSKVNVPILGIIENMAGFRDSTGETIDIFGSGGGASLAASLGVPLLASIPIEIEIRKGGDAGHPVVLDDKSESGRIFESLAKKVVEAVEAPDAGKPEVQIVS